MIKTYEEAKVYLERFIPYIVNHSLTLNAASGVDQLDRMRYFLNLLGNPHQKFPSIVVSGTSGKSSTSYLIAHMLTTAGYKTGLTISPHLVKPNERIQIGKEHLDLEQISDKKYIQLLNEIIPLIESMKNSSYGYPSYYEILMGLALFAFAKEKISVAVVEVGLEGKYDATNLISPLIFVLTNISLDHTQMLGDTIEKIADEATYRIKYMEGVTKNAKKQIMVTAITQPSIIAIAKDRCKEKHVELLRINKDFSYKIDEETHDGVFFRFSQDKLKPKALFVSLRGAYQAENASIATIAIGEMKKFGFLVSEEIIEKSLKTAIFIGRFEEIILKGQTIILDGAHNPTKIAAFLNALTTIYPTKKKIFIIGFKKGKDIKEMLQSIFPVADIIVATKFTATMDWGKNMGIDIKNLKEEIETIDNSKKVIYESDLNNAVKKANVLAEKLRTKDESPLIVITGSLYLVGDVKKLLNKAKL